MKKLLVAGTSLAALIAGPAMADEAPRVHRVYTRPVVAAPVASWTGFYVGGNVGYGWGGSGDITPFGTGIGRIFVDGPAQAAAELAGINNVVSTNPKGVLGGIQIGYNRQINRFVWGFEADYAWANINGSGALTTPVVVPGVPADTTTTTNVVSERLNAIGTVRGRLGYLPTDRFLAYATGGFAYGQASSSTAISMVHTVNNVVTGDTFTSTAGSGSKTLAGWTAGAGGEWAFAPHWSVKAEWLYYNLADLNYSAGSIIGIAGDRVTQFTFVNVTSSARFTGNIARVGLNYRFGG
jgi:outer membrane immunogenic protein